MTNTKAPDHAPATKLSPQLLAVFASGQTGRKLLHLNCQGESRAVRIDVPNTRTHRHLLATIVFTGGLLSMIALALGNTSPGIALAALLSVVALALSFHYLLPGSDFFSAVFANSIGVYAFIYVFFLGENFTRTQPFAQELGFALPLMGFLAGVVWRRREIVSRITTARENISIDLAGAIIWGSPIAAVGLSSFILPISELEPAQQNIALLVAMLIIGLTASLTARSIAAFLLDTAILFEDFFVNAGRLAKPAFAFLTCYSLLAIVYGCLYAIIDRFSAAPNFTTSGASRTITLNEGLYLSIVTLSTVGYGDLTATSGIARLLVASEIIVGVLLLLFGVQAILSSDKR